MILQYLREKLGAWAKGKRFWLLVFPVLLIMLVYYPVGMLLVHRIDDNTEFRIEENFPQSKSRSVAVAAMLMRREVESHWAPNDPIFLPGALLKRMPGFQKGIVAAVSRFAVEMRDQIGRTRGSSQSDPDLEDAAGKLTFAPDIWLFDFKTSWGPTASSGRQYRAAIVSLENYNNRLLAGTATFERRADNLEQTIERIALDLGSASGALANQIEHGGGGWFNFSSDMLYYDVKGRMYAYYLILRELKEDYRSVIQERQLENTWNQMLDTLRFGASLKPFFVFNGSAHSQFVPNQLAMQGFILMRARTQMREVAAILQK